MITRQNSFSNQRDDTNTEWKYDSLQRDNHNEYLKADLSLDTSVFDLLDEAQGVKYQYDVSDAVKLAKDNGIEAEHHAQLLGKVKVHKDVVSLSFST